MDCKSITHRFDSDARLSCVDWQARKSSSAHEWISNHHGDGASLQSWIGRFDPVGVLYDSLTQLQLAH